MIWIKASVWDLIFCTLPCINPNSGLWRFMCAHGFFPYFKVSWTAAGWLIFFVMALGFFSLWKLFYTIYTFYAFLRIIVGVMNSSAQSKGVLVLAFSRGMFDCLTYVARRDGHLSFDRYIWWSLWYIFGTIELQVVLQLVKDLDRISILQLMH